MMEMPKPTDAHKKLELIAGNWTGEEKMMPSPWDPKGGTATATITSRVSLNGFIVKGDYKQSRDGICTFEGHSVWWYDATQSCYVMHWWDTMGVAPNVFKGDFDGNKLTMTCVDHQGHSRLTYNYSGSNSLRSTMEMSQDGKNWMKLFEGSYTRQG
jgi:Protein of unknown function (DUF1579)